MSDVSGLWSVWMIQVCQRAQMPGESTAQFVVALRDIVVNCEFSDLSDEMIRDQFVEKKPLQLVYMNGCFWKHRKPLEKHCRKPS